MGVAGQPITWARRVPQHKIRRLYAADARGIVDEELIDDVGYAMYARCDSIRTVTEAHAGRAKCPRCGAVVHHRWEKDKLLDCACGWQTTWAAYLKSYQGKQLYGGASYAAFLAFLEDWPRGRTPRDKLLLIDRLIHALHVNALSDVTFTRPAAVNLIEGRMRDVSALLDELAYGQLSTPGLREARDAWKRTVDASQESMEEWARRRAAGE